MIHFIFREDEPRYLFLKYDTEEDEKWLKPNSNHQKQPNLTNHLNLVDPICYLKTYNGPQYTHDFLYEYIQASGRKIYWCSIGLWQECYKFFRDNKVQYDGLEPGFFKRSLLHTYDEFKEIVNSWGLSLEPREYQYKAAYTILNWKRSVSELATRAGKTLIAYMIFRYCIEYMNMKKILVIVPSISLVKQMYDDFKDYKEFFKTECIWSGGKLVESSNITVGTFQSLIKFLEKKSKKYNPDFFNQYDCVFVDETHRASAEQIKTIISQPFMKNVIIAFGMTGTLPKEKTIERYCIHALLGAKIQEITTKELKDQGYISDIEIYQYRLKYKDIQKQIKLFIKCAEYGLANYIEVQDEKHPNRKKKLELENKEFLIKNVKELSFGLQQVKANIYSDNNYSDIMKDIIWMDMLKKMIADSTATNSLFIERMMVHFMDDRIDILINEILPKCDKNTLILCHHTEYINHLVEKIKEKYDDSRIIVKIIGNVSSKKREEIKNILKENNNCILVASYGTMSTGITLANLCYGVLFESFKSDVVNMQSIGRGLGLSELKDKYRLFDIVDCFDNKITNKIFLQGLARIKIYNRESNKHKYFIKEFALGNNNIEYNNRFINEYNIFKDSIKETNTKKKKETNTINNFLEELF